MLNSISPNADRFLKDLNRITERADRAQRQLSSGLRLERPSDDPDHVGLLLQTRAELSRVMQVKLNLGRVKTEVETAAQAVGSAVEVVERVRVLASQAATGTQTADTRLMIAGEVSDLLGQLVRTANTNVEGRYIFSGNNDQVAPFSLDLAQTPPVSYYQGTAATRQALNPTGSTFAISLPGDRIFADPDPARNAFETVASLRTALLANDETAIKAAQGNLGSVLSHLNTQVAFYGTVQNQVASSAALSLRMQTQLEIRVGEIEDADLAQAITELQQADLEQQAALGARAKMPQRSLFDYLG